MNALTDRDTDAAVDAYIECALWSSTDSDDAGTPLDDRYGPEDIADEARASMRADVAGFLQHVAAEGLDISGIASTQIGHDFWLTRNRHGAGFWDRGLGELGDRLTTLAHWLGHLRRRRWTPLRLVVPRITELYAYVVADADEDDEGVPAWLGPDGTWRPMMGADRERAESLRPEAEKVARLLGKPVKLVRSTGIEVVGEVLP